METFTVRVYQAPRAADYRNRLDAAGRPKAPPKPAPLESFVVQAPNLDSARSVARAQLSPRGRLRSFSVGQDQCLHAILMHPEDANSDRPS